MGHLSFDFVPWIAVVSRGFVTYDDRAGRWEMGGDEGL